MTAKSTPRARSPTKNSGKQPETPGKTPAKPTAPKEKVSVEILNPPAAASQSAPFKSFITTLFFLAVGLGVAGVVTETLDVTVKDLDGAVLFTTTTGDAFSAKAPVCPKCPKAAEPKCPPTPKPEVTKADLAKAETKVKAAEAKYAELETRYSEAAAISAKELEQKEAELTQLKEVAPIVIPPGQAALVGVKNMKLLEKSDEFTVPAAVTSWGFILAKMEESVLSLGPDAPAQAKEYLGQVSQMLTQIAEAPTKENYDIFAQNAYQVAGALAGIFESTGRFPLGNTYLPGILRCDFCADAKCA